MNYLKQINGFIDSALKTMQEIVSESNILFYKIIEFPLKIVTVLGIFAGFGFTGISYVKNIWLFIAGEFCFAIAVIISLYWYKKIIVKHKTIYGEYVNRLGNYIKEWEGISLRMAKKEHPNNGEFKKDIIRMYNRIEKIFEEKPQMSDSILNIILLVFVVATILLLLSFLPINWSSVFNYFLSV